MFAAHKAQINVDRSEPNDLDLEEAIRIAKKRNALYAEQVVLKSLLKKRTKNKAKSQKKILKNWENDERLRRCHEFVELWNYWRSFYIGDRSFKRWEPKNSAQLTVIESIIKEIKERDLDLGIWIGCTFKSFENSKKFTPTVQMCLSNGVEYYNQFCEDVMADIREQEYLEDALI